MTPTDRLIEKLNGLLANHGMEVDYIEYVKGYWKQADVMRWEGQVKIAHINNATPMWFIGSWDTIRDCLKYPLAIEFRPHRAEADIIVSAMETKTKARYSNGEAQAHTKSSEDWIGSV